MGYFCASAISRATPCWAMVPIVVDRDSPSAQSLMQSLVGFRRKWPGGGFSWDGRFDCVASSFSATLESEARAALALLFKFQWTARSLRTAPEEVQDVATQVGGLRQDQVLVASEPNDTLMAYGLWWPWGDDVTISLRVGIAGHSAQRYFEQFRDIFGVTL